MAKMITNSHCKKCNESWFSIKKAKTGKAPLQCPFCHSYFYWVPRQRIRNKKRGEA